MEKAGSDSPIDFRLDQKLSGKEIVRAYVEAFLASAEVESALSSAGMQTFDVSVLSSDEDLTALTKRSSLIASRLLVAHEPAACKQHEINVKDQDYTEETYSKIFTDIRCPDVQSLANWLMDVVPLIRSGRVIYLPTIRESSQFSEGGSFDYQDKPIGPQAFDVFLRDGKATTLVSDARLAGQMLIPLMRLELPFIEGTELARLFPHYRRRRRFTCGNA